MMNKKILCVAAMLSVFTVKAQLTMTVETPPSGLLLKTQLWNVLIVNGGTSATQMNVNLTLTDAGGQPVLTAVSAFIPVTAGSKQLTSADFSPIQYDYLSNLVIDHDPNGFLPLGIYDACYTLNVIDQGHPQQLQEDCISITVEPLSPPLLNLPENESQAESSYPQFNWIPPAPVNMFSSLSYDFNLVEVQEGQTSAEAIQQNIPVYTYSNQPDIFLNYPSSNAPLDTSKLYAWQVIAKNDYDYSAQSEVWTFRVRPDSLLQPFFDAAPYVKLKQQLDASVTFCEGILKFDYDNHYSDSTATYTITSVEEADLGTVETNGSLTITSGENFMTIDLTGDNRLIDGHTYLFELANPENEAWYMKFIYRAPVAAQ